MTKIPEIEQALSDYKKARNEARKKLNKLNLAKEKYYFLDRIVEPRKQSDSKKNDVELEIAIMDLFKSIGFKCDKPKSDADVDVKIKFRTEYIGLEVKNGNLPEVVRLFQPGAHKEINKDSFNSIVVYNNAKTNQNWDNDRKVIAEKLGIGLILTSELKSGYLKLKNNKITFDEFLNQLQQIGEIKFSNRAIQRAYKSEAPR